ncbi:hypothetical protein PLESTF_000926900 [Pleodorina starrii]|nr:hypothetical protein PLESTF_000926900 [Pleodorina starrii]
MVKLLLPQARGAFLELSAQDILRQPRLQCRRRLDRPSSVPIKYAPVWSNISRKPTFAKIVPVWVIRLMSAGINITVIKDAYKLGLNQSYVYTGICITPLLYAWMKMICDAKVNDGKAFEELQESKPEAFEQLCDYILHITIGNGFNNHSCKYKTSKKPAFAVLTSPGGRC